MGLSLRLGCDESDVETINEILASEGYDPIALVAAPPKKAVPRTVLDSFPYSFLHYLRRAYARVHEKLPLTEVEPDEDPADDEAIEEVAALLDCHLLLHSDSDGFYVPVEFDEPICDRETRLTIGSSVRLLEELALVAPALDIQLTTDGTLTKAEAKRHTNLEEDAPFFSRAPRVVRARSVCARVDRRARGAALLVSRPATPALESSAPLRYPRAARSLLAPT